MGSDLIFAFKFSSISGVKNNFGPSFRRFFFKYSGLIGLSSTDESEGKYVLFEALKVMADDNVKINTTAKY
ncbi:hypothetical protein GCM10025777_25610 [Membranihabitans marinus]